MMSMRSFASILLVVLCSCGLHHPTPDYSNFDLVIKRGKFQMYVPKYFVADKNINRKTEVAYADTSNSTFLMVIREEIPDTEEDSIYIELNNYATFARASILETLQNPHIATLKKITVDENDAIYTAIEGAFAGMDVFYIQMVFRSGDWFYQLTGWTLRTMKDSWGEDIYNSMISFKGLN